MSKNRMNAQDNQQKQIADKVAMVRSQLEVISADVKIAYDARKADFDAPLFSDHSEVRDAPKLAKVLSEKFSSLRFTLTFEGGRQSVRVEPVLPIFGVSDGDYYVDNKLEAAKKTFESIAAGKFWPDFAIVQAFAQGYDKGGARTHELEEELRRLKQDYGYGTMMRMAPWGRLMGPYG